MDAGDFISSNIPLDEDAIERYLRDLGLKEHARIYERADGSFSTSLYRKKVNVWNDFNDPQSVDAHCGTWNIDEAPMWLDARKFDSLSPEAKMKILEHRKDDLQIISTAQDVSFIDKVFRTLCDEIRLVKMVRWPFIGWIWPTCVRPTIVCKDCGRVRRDGQGDDRGVWRWFGFGTAYAWDSFKAKDLLDAQDVTGEDVPAPKRLGGGIRLFDIRIAACYSTSMKLSDKARAAMQARLPVPKAFRPRAGKLPI